MGRTIVNTEFIILRKTPYMESSVIVSGLSPTHGKLDFLIKGDRRISKKKSPEIDLFRLFNVEFSEKSHSLINPIMIELKKSYDKIALFPEMLPEVFKGAVFLLKNEHSLVECPIVYLSLCAYLDRIIKKEKTDFTYIRFAYLYENGLLPEVLTFSDDKENFFAKITLKNILDYTLGKTEELSLSDEDVIEFEKRLDSLCLANHLL